MMSTASDLGRKLGEKLAAEILERVGDEADTAFHEIGAVCDRTAAEEEQFYDDFVAAALDALSEGL